MEGKRCGALIGEFVTRNFLLANERLPLLAAETGESGARLRLHGHAGARVVLESSDDFGNWSAVATNGATMGGVEIPLEVTGQARFFRVREQ